MGNRPSHFKIAHCYTNAGDFTVSVVFTNEEGQAYTGIGPQLVHVVPLTFTASPTNGPTPLTVQFSCPTAEHGASDVTEWQWDFGDGTGSEAQNPTHTYSEVNNYEVSLTVANEDDISTEGGRSGHHRGGGTHGSICREPRDRRGATPGSLHLP